MNFSNVTTSLYHANTTGESCEPSIGEIASTAINLLICLPLNCYMAWIIVVDPQQTLVSCFFELNMSLCEILAELLSPFNLSKLCDYSNFYGPLQCLKRLFFGLLLFGRPLFQTTICVERYVAVVYPVVFLKYRALKYKMVCSSLAWLVVLTCSLIYTIRGRKIAFMFIVMILIMMLVKLFCFMAVLRALKQPQPGDGGRERDRVNQAKIRAFKIIMLLLVNTIVQYAPVLSVWILKRSLHKPFTVAHDVTLCVMISAGFVQPLLFLQRTGRLPGMAIL